MQRCHAWLSAERSLGAQCTLSGQELLKSRVKARPKKIFLKGRARKGSAAGCVQPQCRSVHMNQAPTVRYRGPDGSRGPCRSFNFAPQTLNTLVRKTSTRIVIVSTCSTHTFT